MAPAAMLRSLGHAEAISAEDEIAARPPVGEFLRRAARLRAHRLAASARVARSSARTQARIAAYLARADGGRPVDARPTPSCGRASRSGSEQGPAEMQTVLLLAGVLFHETPVRKVCDARRLSVRTPRLPAAGRRRAVGQLAAGVRPRRAGRARHDRIRASAQCLTEIPADDHVRLARRARRHAVPRGARSVSRQLRPPRPLRIRLGAAALQRGSDADLPGDPRAPRGRRRPARRRPATAAREREAAAAWTAFIERLPWWQRLVDAAAGPPARSPRSSGITSGASGCGPTWSACWRCCAAGTSSSPIGSSNAAGSTIGTTISSCTCRRSPR